MTKKEEADLRGIGFDTKTLNFLEGQSEAFSHADYTTSLEQISSIIERTIRPGKVHRLYRCFSCKRCFPGQRMSGCLVVCRGCVKETQSKGTVARINQIDRILNDIRIYLRGRLEVR